MIFDSVQCRFENKEECYKMVPQVFKDCFQVEFKHDDSFKIIGVVTNSGREIEIENPQILNQIFDALLENDQSINVNNNCDVSYQKISPNGRVEFSLYINKHVVDFVLTILDIATTEFSPVSALLTGGGMLIKIFLESIHINKGFERCVALEIANISGTKNKSFSLDDLVAIFIERISSYEPCPYKKICQKETENNICFLNEKNCKSEINDVLKNLENCGAIVYRNGYYTVAPSVSLE